MQIPSNFTVPDFILENVRVAVEDWPEPSDPASASARIKELRMFMQNPDILYVLCQMVRDLSTAESEVDNHKLAGFHDVFNQQQLIGEKRGLRRFFAELNTIHEQLITTAKS